MPSEAHYPSKLNSVQYDSPEEVAAKAQAVAAEAAQREAEAAAAAAAEAARARAVAIAAAATAAYVTAREMVAASLEDAIERICAPPEEAAVGGAAVEKKWSSPLFFSQESMNERVAANAAAAAAAADEAAAFTADAIAAAVNSSGDRASAADPLAVQQRWLSQEVGEADAADREVATASADSPRTKAPPRGITDSPRTMMSPRGVGAADGAYGGDSGDASSGLGSWLSSTWSWLVAAFTPEPPPPPPPPPPAPKPEQQLGGTRAELGAGVRRAFAHMEMSGQVAWSLTLVPPLVLLAAYIDRPPVVPPAPCFTSAATHKLLTDASRPRRPPMQLRDACNGCDWCN